MNLADSQSAKIENEKGIFDGLDTSLGSLAKSPNFPKDFPDSGIREMQKLAEEKHLTCFFVANKGKGSHGRLYLGSEFTTLKDRKKELGKGLLGKMCRDLKIRAEEL